MSETIILLVEDNPDDEELALGALARAGIVEGVAVARDGAEALEWLFPSGGEARRPLPRVILLDIKLPRVDGLEVLERLRDRPETRHTPVVMLSSSDVARDVEAAYRLGANSYVQKPVEFDRYEETLTEVAAYWARTNQIIEGSD